jgi:tubulin monoglycylase TTLL3/8
MNPLTIWLYDEPYVRFSAEDYNPQDISNIYAHLTNNSIGVKSNLFDCSEIEGNMWNIETFSEYLSSLNPTSEESDKKNIWRDIIQKKIKDIIIYSMESVQDIVVARKKTHEVFGFDLMVDEEFNVWLIEINSSPCMEYSTVYNF